jgi:hypothetical protein
MLQFFTSLKRLSRRLRFDRKDDLLSLALNNVTRGLLDEAFTAIRRNIAPNSWRAWLVEG